MKQAKSSSFPFTQNACSIDAIELKPSSASQEAQNQSFSVAINALTMARRYLLEGDETAAEQKAAAALLALRHLTECALAGRPLTH